MIYRVEQNNSCMFESTAFVLPPNLGQPMHCQTALTEHGSLNLAGTFLIDPVEICCFDLLPKTNFPRLIGVSSPNSDSSYYFTTVSFSML